MRRPAVKARSRKPAAVAKPPAVVAAASYPGGYYRRPAGLYPGSQDDGKRDFRPKLTRDVTRLVPEYKQRDMVSDGRWIYARVGQVSGAIREKANYSVGTAFAPQYYGSDEAFRTAFTTVMSRWCRNADLRGAPFDFQQDVWIASVALDRDGDAFLVLTESEQGSPRLQFLESHRIGNPNADTVIKDGPYAGRTILSGVVYDEFDRPLAYNLLPRELANYAAQNAEPNLVPASSVLHLYDPEYYSQGRGVPTIVNGVLDWFDLNEIRSAEKVGQKGRSRIMMQEYNDTGLAKTPDRQIRDAMAAANAAGTTPSAADLDPSIRIMEEGTIAYMRANSGHKLESMGDARPGANWEGFMDHIARSAHRGLDWPLEMHDLRGIGGASVRALVGQVKRAVENRQEILTAVFRSAVLYAVARYMKRGDIPFTADWDNIGFSLPATFGVDVGRDAANNRQDLAMGIKSLSEYVTESGDGDVETFLRRNAQTWKLVERIATEEGVEASHIYNPGVASQPASVMFADDSNSNELDPPPRTRGQPPTEPA